MIQFTEEIKDGKSDKKLHISDVRNSFIRRKELLQGQIDTFQKWQEEYKSKFMGGYRFKDQIR